MKHRLLRVNELLKRELSIAITREITFDGALVTVNQVDVTPDLKQRMSSSASLAPKRPSAVTAKLEENRVMLQNEISPRVCLEIHAASDLSSR